MRRWRRVSVFGPTQIGAVLFTVFGLGFTAVLVRGFFFAGPRPGLVVVTLFSSLWTASAWRTGRVGVFVNDEHGVRSRSMLRTRTLPWDGIAGFEDRPATAGPSGWAANTVRARAIWIVPQHGPAFQTALVYRSSEAEFLPPEPGLLNNWERTQSDMQRLPPLLGLGRRAERAQVVNSEQHCRAVLHQLRDALRDHRQPPAPATTDP